MSKRIEERLQAVQERRKKLEAREQLYKAKLKEKERKERTRRLIKIGAILSSIGIDTEEKAEQLAEKLKQRTSRA